MNAEKAIAKVVAAALALCVSMGCAAEDLMSVYRKALQSDAAFQAARAQFEANSQKLAQARAALRPALSLNGNASRQEGDASYNRADHVDKTVRNSALNLQLSQPLWRSNLSVARDQAELQVQQSGAVFRQAEIDLMLRVAQAYLDTVVARESVRVALGQTQAVEQQLALAERNYQAGVSTVTDVHEAKARRELARAQHRSALSEADGKAAELEKLLGEAVGPLAPLGAQARMPALAEDQLQPLTERAKADSPLVQAQLLALDIAKQEVRKLSAGHEPTLDLTASYGHNRSSGSMTSPTEVASRTRAAQVGIQFNLPLYSGGAVQSRVREAWALVDKATSEAELARRQVATQVRQAHAGAVHGQAQVDALAGAVDASRSAVESNKVGYRIGTRINIDVLNAEQQLSVAERDLFKARSETILHALRLKAATGELSEADLAFVNGLLKGE